MTSTAVTFRIDKGLKEQADQVLESMGMNMTTALTVFTKTLVREGRMPFPIVADPFFHPANQAWLRSAAADAATGRGTYVTKTMAELDAMADA
ncbi:MAG: type II toxin-antitoxin system RelB/DinJ family antitoxin [Micrococcales bacterium]|nr:type II toxin-antitoxin system RelB/DinJ family antitoxin [Micrococcales bacterium]MCL2668754.1 type II toxin-antitoxin system RelB/DinJ family antitoxin [Micrococcales bacterium]